MVRIIFSALLLASCAAVLVTAQAPPAITIRVGRLLDGRGSSQQNVVVTIRDGRIASVAQSAGPVTYDLSKYTLLPGFIDTHVHLLWHFGPNGRFAAGGESRDDRVKAGIADAKLTVESGFTTVQSVGEAGDLDLRKALEEQQLP